MRTFNITRDRKKMLGIEFSQHHITRELVVSLCSSGGPAAKSGIEVGDRVISIQVRRTQAVGLTSPRFQLSFLRLAFTST